MSNRNLAVAIILLAVVVVTIVVLTSVPSQDPVDLADRLEKTRAALVASENLEPREAAPVWDEVFEQAREDASPGLESIARNRALNRLLLVEDQAGRVDDFNLSEAEREQAREALPASIESARAAIEDYRAVGGDPVLATWMNSRVVLREAALLAPSAKDPALRSLFESLAEAIGSQAGQSSKAVILGGPLTQVIDDLEDPATGLPDSIASEAAAALGQLSDRHPDNLFIALNAGRRHVADENAAAQKYVRRSWDLARAIAPTLRRSTEPLGITPEQLNDQIVEAIEQENWRTAESKMLLWFNLLNPTELVKADRRRASPHPIDWLSFEALRLLSDRVTAENPAPPGTGSVDFESVSVGSLSRAVGAEPIDFDLDLDSDLAVVDAEGALTLWQNDGDRGWSSVATLETGIAANGVISADLFMVDSSDPDRLRVAPGRYQEEAGEPLSASRHDTFPGLLVYGSDGIRLVSVDGRRETAADERLSLSDDPTGLEDVAGVNDVAVGDFEGDGDLDVVAATSRDGVRMFVNRGNRTFFEVPPENGATGLRPEVPVTDLAIVDLDRDLDLDFVTVSASTGRVGLIENLLHLQFRYRDLEGVPAVPGARRVEVADLDGNVSWDLVVGGRSRAEVIYSQTSEAGLWTVDSTESLEGDFTTLALADFNNDSWMELVQGVDGSLEIFPLAPTPAASIGRVEGPLSSGPLGVTDFNGDGRVDLSFLGPDGPRAATNVTDSVGHYLQVRLRGIDDNAANSGRVNHYAIGSVLELWFGPHYRSRVITDPSTHFGLGSYENASSLRVIFPNGLTQTLRQPETDTVLEEEQQLKGSCPYLYTWNGERFTFVTDCLWAAPLGLQVADGVVAKDRPWEYLKVDGELLKPREGKYELRLTEELWEIAYFDHVALQAVDHPADVDVWTNEKVGPPDVAQPRIYAFKPEHRLPPRNATDTSGRDVLDRLASRDGDYVQGFDRRLRQGLCPPHWIDLDFGPLPPVDSDDRRAYLVLTGWILPTDTSLNMQIDQNPELPAVEFPSVWVPDASAEGGWREAIPFMGFPGGKTKTIVVDVTEVVRPDATRLRVRTSAQIYWDAAELAVTQRPGEFVTQDLTLEAASVARHGFSRRIERGDRRPETYDYHDASTEPKWPPLGGRLTRFGECRELLTAWDDSMVVIGAGDEIRLTFDAPEDPPPEGWTRDFVLHCVGWDKDADLNTLTGQHAQPLPSRRMTTYPPSLLDPKRGELMEQNRDHLTRKQSFRAFWNRGQRFGSRERR